MGEIQAEAAADPDVVAAKKALDAVEGGDHKYTEIKAAYDKAYNDAFLSLRNVYVENSKFTKYSCEKEGKYYILNETPEQANARYLKEHGINPRNKLTLIKLKLIKLKLMQLKQKKQLKKQKLVKLVQNKLVKLFQKQAQLNNLIIN